jgi:hypothetical protein
MIIIATRIVIITIVFDYFAEFHDPIVDFLASSPLDLIVLEASIVIPLEVRGKPESLHSVCLDESPSLTRVFTFFPPELSLDAVMSFAGVTCWICFCTLAIVLDSVVLLGFFIRTIFVFWLISGTRMNR